MAKRHVLRYTAVVLSAAALAGGGCNQQDADSLAKIGNLLVQRAQSLKQKSAANTRLTRALPDLGMPDENSDLERKVEDRLRSEPSLTSLSIRVQAEGGRVRLIGRVSDDGERRKVVAAAESAIGAGNVIDELERVK